MNNASRKRFNANEKKAVLVRFEAKDPREKVTVFAKRMGISVPTLYEWRRKSGSSRKARKPRAARVIRRGRPVANGIALPPPEKLTESQRLALENSILRGLIRLARAEGFAATVDLSLGIARA